MSKLHPHLKAAIFLRRLDFCEGDFWGSLKKRGNITSWANQLGLNLSSACSDYIYIYTYTRILYTYMYIYIYIFISMSQLVQPNFQHFFQPVWFQFCGFKPLMLVL